MSDYTKKIGQVALVMIIILYSCATHSHPDKKIFRYNEASGIATLDPAFAKNQSIMWPVHQLYNTLIELDDSLKLVPSLAKSWHFSEDKRTITFFLRNDVFFHDDACFENGTGRKFTAADVVYSLGRIIDPATASPGAWIFNDRVDSAHPFTVIDDTTFQIRLVKPFQPILGILSMQYCSIVAKEAVEKYGTSFRAHPVGTGPFKMVSWTEGQALILKKNERYFEVDSTGKKLPYLDGIKISFYDSKATEFLEFRQGRLDFINDIDPSFKDEVLTKTGSLKKQWIGKIILDKHEYLSIEYFGILSDTTNPLLKNSPLRNKKIRQAMSHAIDRKKLMLYIRNSIGTPALSGFIPAGVPGFDSAKVKGYEYNPAKARQLLKEAGFENGKGMPEITLLTIPVYASIGSFVANELKQTGINVKVESIQKNLLIEQASKSQAVFFRANWMADYPDAENYLSVFYSKNPAPPNYTRYKNPEFDRLYEKALEETNDEKRFELNRQMDRLIMEDIPVIPIWYDMAIHLVHNNVTNFKANGLNGLELRKVSKL